MTFTVTRLTDQRALVNGEDVNGVVGQQVVDTSQWDEIIAHNNQHVAQAQFDEAVEKFFEPLTKAAAAQERAGIVPEDKFGLVVLHEEQEGVAPLPAVVIELTYDSMILRAVDEGETDRLIWVNDRLEVLAKFEDIDIDAPVSFAVVEDALAAVNVESPVLPTEG